MMTKEEYNYRLLKQASIGYAQSLSNRGYSPQQVEAAVQQYTDPSGLLAKRANTRFNKVAQLVYNTIKGIN